MGGVDSKDGTWVEGRINAARELSRTPCQECTEDDAGFWAELLWLS